MGIDARISAHAIERYQQRVAPCSRRAAREALQSLLEKGRVTEKGPTPLEVENEFGRRSSNVVGPAGSESSE